MSYEEFKKKIIDELITFYEDDAQVIVAHVTKNNGIELEGVSIRHKDSEQEAIPLVYLNYLYDTYQKKEFDIDTCVGMIVDMIEKKSGKESIKWFVHDIMEWERIKEDVYPILVSTESNPESLSSLISINWLDLSICYLIRRRMGLDEFSIKINEELFENYGISKEELHKQAILNLEKDGYGIYDLGQCIQAMMNNEDTRRISTPEVQSGEMYIFRNESACYGAAGILSQKILWETIGYAGLDCYIIPSSVHERIFLPATSDMIEEFQEERLDEVIREVNETKVKKEELLADHCYYYNAQTGEITIRR